MSDSANKAVFLSYASQDAAAAKRIAEALRAAGVEVWFDQDELVGGDAWDAKIRGQIGACALFVPVISANTQARLEGYFRLEWKLAAQRTHMMSERTTFLLPVIIDATRDAEADVPVEFKAVQWTKLPRGETPPAFAARVQKLLGGEVPAAAAASAAFDRVPRRPAKPFYRTIGFWTGLALCGVLVAYQAWRRTEKPAAAPPPVPGDVSGSELARVRARIIPDRWQREDFGVVSAMLDRLIQAEPENADAWALRSIINSLQVVRNFDAGTRSLEAGKADADRALRLAPGSPLGELAFGIHLVAMTSRGGDIAACRPYIDRAVAALPAGALTRYTKLVSYWFGYEFKHVHQVAHEWLEAEPQASFPAWILSQSSIVQRQPDEAEKWAERALVDSGITGVRAYYTLFESKYYLRADLPAARTALDRMPAAGRSVHRVVHARWLLAMADQKWDEALQELARVPEPFLFDRSYHGPKALLAGFAHQRAGRPEAATSQFREAERLLRGRLAADPDNEELHGVLAVTLASSGRSADARGELALIEPLVQGRAPTLQRGSLALQLAQAHAILGDQDRLVVWLRRLLAEPSQFPFTPAALRIDPRFVGRLEAPEVQALLREFASLDQAADGGKPDDKSVAVLAFANLSDDKGNEYFSDGISEELLNVLAKVPGLKVTARTSSFHFKGKDTSIPEIARQLGVAYVIEGSVRKQGDKVRITAQLIKADGGFHVWSDTFTRDLKDIFAVQDEIAGLIAQNLQLTLRTSGRVRSVNPEAYELLLKGRAVFARGVPAEYPQGIRFLQDSLALDPSSAAAWGRLSMGYMLAFAQNVPGWLSREEMLRLARQAAGRAVELDPEQASGHYAQCLIAYLADWNWAQADASMQRVLALTPGDAESQGLAASLALTAGQISRARDAARQAVALDPLNFLPAYQLLKAHWQSGDYVELEKEARRVITIHPGSPYGHIFLSYSLVLRGRAAEAGQVAAQVPSASYRLTCLALAYYAQGKHAEADAALEKLKQQFGATSAYQVAENYAFRKEPDRAFEWLEAAYRDRDSGLTLITRDPFLENLRGDARWVAFMRKMNLPDGSAK